MPGLLFLYLQFSTSNTSFFSEIQDGQRFLLFEEVLNYASQRIWYATNEAMDALLLCDNWLVAGTFQVLLKLFKQI